MMFRQGDVQVFKVTDPEDLSKWTEVPRDAGRVVLARGEVTGHAHVIRDPGVCHLRREGISDTVITSPTVCFLTHEEHDTIEIPAGTYYVRIQREYSEFEHGTVQD